ncbi:hypothetical protein DH2020_031257 [Rehmannia glutinosa]|uniref:GDSL esterase/lipase n=1 Tax=Rehmannia glutinosa TaxID=99300 RepID=A0ABR0VK45_REHGL
MGSLFASACLLLLIIGGGGAAAKVPAVIVFETHRLMPQQQPDFHGAEEQFPANVIPLWREVEYYKDYQNKLKAYLGDTKANSIISESLYIISLGTNDFLENYYTLPSTRSKFRTVDQFQDFLIGLAEKFMKDIYGLGARKMSLTGLPPMGCLPLERTTNFVNGNGDGCMDGYNVVALHFNEKLSGLVKKMNDEMPGIRVVFSNPYGVFMSIIHKPSEFGKLKYMS